MFLTVVVIQLFFWFSFVYRDVCLFQQNFVVYVSLPIIVLKFNRNNRHSDLPAISELRLTVTVA